MTEKRGVLFVSHQDTLALLDVEAALRVCEQVYLMHARGSVVLSTPPSFKLDIADGFHNHWHVNRQLGFQHAAARVQAHDRNRPVLAQAALRGNP
jgi:hypothetical protein